MFCRKWPTVEENEIIFKLSTMILSTGSKIIVRLLLSPSNFFGLDKTGHKTYLETTYQNYLT